MVTQDKCREGYADAEGLLHHLENVGSLLQEALGIADLARLEVHGPEDELSKLRKPLKEIIALKKNLKPSDDTIMEQIKRDTN